VAFLLTVDKQPVKQVSITDKFGKKNFDLNTFRPESSLFTCKICASFDYEYAVLSVDDISG